MAYYFGLNKAKNIVEIFSSKIIPNAESHGNKYGCVFGPYWNKKVAINKACYQFSYNTIYFLTKNKATLILD